MVANGRSQQQGIDCDETFSPVVKPATIRTVLSLAVSRYWPIHQLDVKNAFLHGQLSKTVYMHQPPRFVDSYHPDYVCLLQHSLYGLKQAPRAWFQRFASFITRVGFQHSKTDASLFVYRQGSDIAYLLLYVDDIVLTASSATLLQRIITLLHSEFAMTDLGSLNYFLGISAQRSPSGLFLSQSKFAEEILERAHMEHCNPCKTPVDTESKLGSDGDPVSDPTLYRSLAGALQYLTFTRPDISYAVQQVCLYMHDPREPHFTALKRILRYVRGTLDHGLQLHVSSTAQLTAYTDADWAGCPVTRRSTSGYCVFLGDNLLSWSAKRQVTLSRSSAEAEYRGVANVVAETAWVRNLLLELHAPLTTATLVYCDNVSAVYLSTNPVQHQRTKHIEIDIHFVRDYVASGHVRVLHVPSRFQYADIFTKGLPSALFLEFRSSLNVRRPPVPTAEEY
ncbi:ribonuclease H-like domain-containing protein [Tanacetum coccineum]